jgi:hypothetical protein
MQYQAAEVERLIPGEKVAGEILLPANRWPSCERSMPFALRSGSDIRASNAAARATLGIAWSLFA